MGSSFSTTSIARLKMKIDFADSSQDTLQALFKGLSTLGEPRCDDEITAAEMIGILDLTNKGSYSLVFGKRLVYLHITNVNQAVTGYRIRTYVVCQQKHSFHI